MALTPATLIQEARDRLDNAGVVILSPPKLSTAFNAACETWCQDTRCLTDVLPCDLIAGQQEYSKALCFDRLLLERWVSIRDVSKITNLLTYSEQLDNAVWVPTNLAVAANAVADPNGLLTAETLTASAPGGILTQAVTQVLAPFTFSVYLRRKTGVGNIQLTADGVTYVTVAVTAAWARYSVTATTANPVAGIKIATNADAVWAWGAQLESGSLVYAYTPTTTVAVTTSTYERPVRLIQYDELPNNYRNDASGNPRVVAVRGTEAYVVYPIPSVTVKEGLSLYGYLYAPALAGDLTVSNVTLPYARDHREGLVRAISLKAIELDMENPAMAGRMAYFQESYKEEMDRVARYVNDPSTSPIRMGAHAGRNRLQDRYPTDTYGLPYDCVIRG